MPETTDELRPLAPPRHVPRFLDPGPFAAALVALLALSLAAGCGDSQPAPTAPAEGPAPAEEPASAAADDLLPLPSFTPCASSEHPELPAKWQSSALLQDFVQNHLVFGHFVYDQDAAAFRFRLSDRYGSIFDMIATEDGRLYELLGGDEPTGCILETTETPFTVPSRDWLATDAVCVGQAPILERDQAWWKTPSGEGANWIWYDAERELPFRTMYYEDTPITTPVPVYEHFTFNYFPDFTEVAETDLAELVDFCEDAAPTATPSRSWQGFDAHVLFEDNSYPEPSGESIALAQAWLPGLSECSSISDLPPPWPEQVQGSVMMTAVSFDPNPFPTRVFYDWTERAQNTSLYYFPPTATDYVQVALLTGDTGYIRIEDESGGISMCEQSLPGPQVPDWKVVDGCECRAQIAPGTVLNPSDVPTKILWCPTDLLADQVFWTWYSDTGTPVVFMQTNSSPTAGTGLNLADYYGWKPGSEAPSGTFDLPAACEGLPKVEVPQACHNCHLPLNG